MKPTFAHSLATLTLTLLATVGIQTNTIAADGLDVGQELPPFLAINQDGQLWKAADHLGEKNIVIYFYPAAMTGGCTKQACAFRDDASKLESLDTIVVGVSGDVPAGLKVFQQSEKLNFDLLSDYDGKIARLLGVPTRDGGSLKREFEGKEFTLERGITTSRWTFVIGKDKKVSYKNTEVNAAEDSKAVIGFLQQSK